MFSIRLGVPEMELRWTDLCEKAAGKLAAAEKRLHKSGVRPWHFSLRIHSIRD